jgi:eukaryotic-like serine/threonine-protein kinase
VVAAELGSTAEEGQLLVGRYRLFRRIAAGAMGVVWQGHDERLNRPVAVKKLLLHPALSARQAADAVARCLREGRIAARLHHPNAITVFDVVDDDDVPCLVMEYMPSRSLATVMAEDGALAPGAVADVGAQVAAALTAAHAANIVHRDVTPGNILLGEDGPVKLTDFGISRATDDVTATRSFAGTPAYLAPEVALGDGPTSASDVFSLGSTLYAAVEGEPPFGRAANTLGLLHAVAGGRIKPPRRSGPLTDALVALLEPDPSARPTAAEARDLLAAVESAPEPVLAPTIQTAAVEVAPARRSYGPLAVAGVFVVALMAVGLWLLGGHDGLRPAEEQAPAPGTSQTAPGSATDPVAPVHADQPKDAPQAPATSTENTPPAPPTTHDAQDPATATTTPPPPTTTDAQAPPTGDTTPPPAGGEETAPAPPTTAVAG